MHVFVHIISFFECHMSNTYKYTDIQQNKTYLYPVLLDLRDTIDFNMILTKPITSRTICTQYKTFISDFYVFNQLIKH